MQRIAFVLPNLEGGGAERVAVYLATGFLKRGHPVDFVLVKAEGPLLETVPSGARVVDLHAHRIIASVPRLTAYLRRERPAALIATPDIMNPIAIWAKLLSRSRTRTLIGAHSDLAASAEGPYRLRWRALPRLLHLFWRSSDVVVAVSSGAADALSRSAHIPRGRITVIYNPLPTERILESSAEPVDHPWFKAGEPPVILTAGRLSVQKDYATLLQAFAMVRARRNARLVILGEGAMRGELTDLTEKLGIGADVAMPGFESNPYRYMARCDVFVLSSRFEGLPNALLEALACSPQVVSTDCPSGPAEILGNGKYGRLVPVGDIAALANAIEDALDGPLPTEMLRARAQEFSVDAATDAYLRVLGLA